MDPREGAEVEATNNRRHTRDTGGERGNIGRLLTATNLSYDRLSRYPRELEANNMVVVERRGLEVKVKPTSRALAFLREYRRLREVAVALGITI